MDTELSYQIDICKNFELAELIPRFHFILLCHLLDSNLSEDSAMTWANVDNSGHNETALSHVGSRSHRR